jgi:hypothetical protein
MTDQNAFPPSTPPAPRREHETNWIPGVILIVLGAIFLLGTLTGYQLQNWWAVFLLIPALGGLTEAYRRYRGGEGFTRRVQSNLFIGLLLTALACVFLFNLNMALFGPLLLVLLGVLILSGSFFKRE